MRAAQRVSRRQRVSHRQLCSADLPNSDLGKTWQSVASNLPSDWPARVVREGIPSNENLLFAGTETGLYASFNGGGSWIPLAACHPRPLTTSAFTNAITIS